MQRTLENSNRKVSAGEEASLSEWQPRKVTFIIVAGLMAVFILGIAANHPQAGVLKKRINMQSGATSQAGAASALAKKLGLSEKELEERSERARGEIAKGMNSAVLVSADIFGAYNGAVSPRVIVSGWAAVWNVCDGHVQMGQHTNSRINRIVTYFDKTHGYVKGFYVFDINGNHEKFGTGDASDPYSVSYKENDVTGITGVSYTYSTGYPGYLTGYTLFWDDESVGYPALYMLAQNVGQTDHYHQSGSFKGSSGTYATKAFACWFNHGVTRMGLYFE